MSRFRLPSPSLRAPVRRFFAWAAVGLCAATAEARVVAVTILNTTDLHGALLTLTLADMPRSVTATWPIPARLPVNSRRRPSFPPARDCGR